MKSVDMGVNLIEQTNGRLNHGVPYYPLITVIVAIYNGARTLQQCIDSIAQQSYPAKELIVIDGASTDGTVGILKQNMEKISHWVSEPDRGIYDAWNKGLAQAKGEWICFLGADDYFWERQVLVQVSEQLVSLPEKIRVAYGQVMLLNNDGARQYPIGEPWEKIKERFKQFMCIPHPGAMHRRSLFELHGYFDDSFCIAGDYELLLRELKTEDAFFIPDVILVGMRQGGISSNPTYSLASIWEIWRAQRKHGRKFPGRIWLMALIRVYARLLLVKLLGERTVTRLLNFRRKIMGLDKPIE